MSNQRPAPLYQRPDLIELLVPDVFTTPAHEHASCLEEALAGAVLVVAGDRDRLDRIATVAQAVPGTTDVDTVHNQATRSADLDDVDLPPAEPSYDTIVYSKETTAWFARSRDFQRLTDRLRTGGTFVTKTRWLPGSNRLTLTTIAVANAFSFKSPDVYTVWEKSETQATFQIWDSPSATPVTTTPSKTGPQGCAESGNNTRPPVWKLTTEFESQFSTTEEETEYRSGWSWHSDLQDYAEQRAASVDSPVVNLCAGGNPIGDIRIDLLADETTATVQADAAQAPLPRDSAGMVITDPPWKIPLEQRVRLFSEAHRITQPGGRILLNAWWIGHHPYARVVDCRATTANVLDDSLNGPGGLSFLTEFEVLAPPDFGSHTYTLADHMRRHGVEAINAYQDWPQQRGHPVHEPRNDPRIVGGDIACCRCQATHFVPYPVGDNLLYQCQGCQFRYFPTELLNSETPDEPEYPESTSLLAIQ